MDLGSDLTVDLHPVNVVQAAVVLQVERAQQHVQFLA